QECALTTSNKSNTLESRLVSFCSARGFANSPCLTGHSMTWRGAPLRGVGSFRQAYLRETRAVIEGGPRASFHDDGVVLFCHDLRVRRRVAAAKHHVASVVGHERQAIHPPCCTKYMMLA